MPAFRQGERPAAFADRIGEWYVARPSDRQRKAHGLFLTPVPVADHMGAQITAEGRKVRVLDPAAGTGILCCAAVEALVSRRPKPDAIELTACEVDGGLIAALRAVLDRLHRTHIGVGAQLLAQSRTAHGAFRERDMDDRFPCRRAPQPPRCGTLTDTRNDQCVNGRWFTQRMRWREFHMLYHLPPSTLPLNLEPRSLRAQRAPARMSKRHSNASCKTWTLPYRQPKTSMRSSKA